jgi:glycosyltransferase involved in cell wall biosynthesis
MLSIIIIGRNEGWKLTKCIKSVYKTIKFNALKDYEILYVDSKSNDDSVERAQKFNDIKIFKITGICNAAIARNIGAKESKGEILFFIDGDMEIEAKFLPLVYSEKNGLKYEFVSGQLKNYNYDNNGNLINQTWQYKSVLTKDKYFSTTGGIFLIEKRLWEKIEGMDNRFKRGEELDLGLRLAKMGYKILRKKEIIANHNTISYKHHSRMWKTLFSGDVSYSGSFLFRKHIFNQNIYSKIIKQYYTLFSLIIFVIISLIFKTGYFSFLYIFVLFIKSLKSGKKNLFRNIELFFFFFLRDISFVLYLFFPLKRIDQNQIKYKRI